MIPVLQNTVQPALVLRTREYQLGFIENVSVLK